MNRKENQKVSQKEGLFLYPKVITITKRSTVIADIYGETFPETSVKVIECESGNVWVTVQVKSRTESVLIQPSETHERIKINAQEMKGRMG